MACVGTPRCPFRIDPRFQMLGSAHPKARRAASQEAWPERLKFYRGTGAIDAIFGKILHRNDSYLAKVWSSVRQARNGPSDGLTIPGPIRHCGELLRGQFRGCRTILATIQNPERKHRLHRESLK